MFEDAKAQITFQTPLLCTLQKILQINEEKKFTSVLLQDASKNQILGFLYGEFYSVFKSSRILSRLPISIVISKGSFKSLNESTDYLEIHHVVIENQTYINSNWIGSHEYCEMQTYLSVYINAASTPNKQLFWGNLIHDYLASFFFSSRTRNDSRHRRTFKIYHSRCV